MQIGKAMGARVIATAGGPEKAEFCRALGADEVVDYRAQDIAEGVRALTDGRAVDRVRRTPDQSSPVRWRTSPICTSRVRPLSEASRASYNGRQEAPGS